MDGYGVQTTGHRWRTISADPAEPSTERFTSISTYLIMMEALGVLSGELLRRLITPALDQYPQRQIVERGLFELAAISGLGSGTDIDQRVRDVAEVP